MASSNRCDLRLGHALNPNDGKLRFLHDVFKAESPEFEAVEPLQSRCSDREPLERCAHSDGLAWVVSSNLDLGHHRASRAVAFRYALSRTSRARSAMTFLSSSSFLKTSCRIS